MPRKTQTLTTKKSFVQWLRSRKGQKVGIKNYIEVFTRDDCFGSLKLALFYIAGGIVQLALFFATILCFKTKGGAIFKGFFIFPYLISSIAIGFIFKFFFTRGFVFDTVLGWIGLNSGQSALLAQGYLCQ